MIILRRLKAAGAEARIWRTQFGFKSKHGTADAIFLARRLLDESCASQNSPLILLALDWAKAFDSVMPDALLEALRRFGLPPEVLGAVRAIYSGRSFAVKDSGLTSTSREQRAGICQGCPLSPFLFAMVMTVLLSDAKRSLGDLSELVDELVYADDTLIVASAPGHAEQYMKAVERAGANYGLNFNWGKLEVLSVGSDAVVRRPDGGAISQKTSIVYLGSVLSADGTMQAELGRRLGQARAEFDLLCRVWNRSSIPVNRKILVYEACVQTKLLYSLHTSWFKRDELARIDAFQARCLRKILGIQHSYVSRVSNESVLARARRMKLSSVLLQRQLMYFFKVACKGDDHPLRSAIFKPSSLDLRPPSGKRKRSRPRQTWSAELYKLASDVCASLEVSIDQLRTIPVRDWKQAVLSFCLAR